MTGSRPLTELEIQSILQAFTGKYEIRNHTRLDNPTMRATAT